MRVLLVEDEPLMADAIRDGLRLEAIAADIARDGDTALQLLSFNAYDIAVLDRDIPGPSGDEIAERIVASGSGMPILMLTAADRLDDKATGFELGADDYLTKPFELRELVLRLRALDRRRAHNRPPSTREESVDRAPGLSVRLKLTLSYAGFLMLAGVVLLAAGYFSLSRGVHPGVIFMVQSHADLLRYFAPIAAIVMTFLLVFGLVAGWLLAGRMLAPLTHITDATRTAASGSLSHRIQLSGRKDEFRELADAFDTMLARLEAHVAEQQRFAANASHELRTPLAITQTLLDVAHNDRNGDNGENPGENPPPQLVSTLAEPFLRGAKRIRTDHAGVGLGLAIVKSITQAHDGTLTLTPRAAGGLRATVQLPAAPPHTGG